MGSRRKNQRASRPGPPAVEAPPPAADRRRGLLVALLAAAMAVAIYLPTLTAPFVYDDLPYVERNESIRDVTNAPSLWVNSYPPGREVQGLYRPMTATTYLVDHALYGLDGGRFHLTNTLLHGLATALFTLVLARLAPGRFVPLVGGLLFAVHPVHVEAVAWVVGRAEVLAGVFCFTSLLGWVAWRRGGSAAYLAIASVAWFLGMASKETAAPLLGVFVLGDALGVFAEPGQVSSRRRLLGAYLALVPALALYVVLRAVALDGALGVGDAHRVFFGHPALTRFATALAAAGRSARLLVWPTDLRVDHGDLLTDQLASWRVALGLAVILGMVAAAALLRKRRPVIAFWIGWAAIIMLPFSNLVIEIGTILAERILYVPSAGACAVAAILIARGIAAPTRPAIRWLAAIVLAVAVVGLSAATWARIGDWRDAERFWRSEMALAPRSEKAHINLAGILWDRGEALDDDALREESDEVLRRGIALHEDSGRGYSRAHVHMRFNLANHLRGRGRIEDALPHYGKVSEILVAFPEFDYDARADAFVDHGTALREQGRLDDAAVACRRAIQARPDFALAHEHLAYIENLRRDYEPAIVSYRQAAALQPERGDLLLNLGQLLNHVGRPEEAVEPLVAAVRSGAPGSGPVLDVAVSRVYDAHVAAGDDAAAYATLSRLAEVGRETAENAYRRGALMEQLGDPARAGDHYRSALELDPDHAAARDALAGR